jgi:hypothetical protein
MMRSENRREKSGDAKIGMKISATTTTLKAAIVVTI